MKKYLYIICAMAAGVLSSCSQKGADAMEQDGDMQRVTLKVDIQDESLTRAASTEPTRFLVEVYQGGASDYDYTTPANIFAGNTTNKSEVAATGGAAEFDLVLDRRLTYRFVLWADQGGAAVYNTDALKTGVSLKTGQNPVQAWYHGDKEARSGVYNTISVVLNRVVSKVNFKETGSLKGKADQNLVVKYDQPTALTFVGGLPVTATPVERVVTIPVTTDVTGTTQAPVTLNTDAIYILSSGATADLATFDFKLGTEADFKVSNAPMKANFITNIIGHFTAIAAKGIIVKGEGEWETPDIEVPAPKAGDYVYKDKTYSSTYTDDAQNPVIGVVVSANGKDVKILGFETSNTTFAEQDLLLLDDDVLGAHSDIDGAINQSAILASNDEFYQAAIWCSRLTTGGLNWYMPAINELQAIWTNKTAINAALVALGKTSIAQVKAHSSTYTGPGKIKIMNYADGAIDTDHEFYSSTELTQAMAKVTVTEKE